MLASLHMLQVTPTLDPPSEILDALATYSHQLIVSRAVHRLWRADAKAHKSIEAELPFTMEWITPMLSIKIMLERLLRMAGKFFKKQANSKHLAYHYLRLPSFKQRV